MKRKIYIFFVVMMASFSLLPNVNAQRFMEDLDHGLIAVDTGSGIYVSWRVLASEWYDVSYNIYRDGVLVNDTPVDGASNLLDASGTTSSTYSLKLVEDGVETDSGESCVVWEDNSYDIPVRTISVDGDTTLYTLNDASVGDLDGDGEYEIVVKRLVADNDTALTYYHYLEAYKLDGTFMWAANMGPNIYDGTEFNFLVYDLDMDGKAEIVLRTSDGFVDGEGNDIGDYDGDGVTNYRYSVSTWLTTGGYRCEGPDYVSVLDGETGKQLAITDYIERGDIASWGKSGDGGHRATKCMYTVAYLDGKKPSFIIGRGIYARTAFAAYTYSNGTLTQEWTFDSNDDGNSAYAGQGYHNLTLGDVDLDGRDELVYGSMVMDDDGTGLYSTGLGHGDAQHLADINPYRKGLEYFACLEDNEGGDYRDAGTGEIFYYQNIGRDMGRSGCGDITPDYPGMEMWGTSDFAFLASDGTEITDLESPSIMNFLVWWDGDVSRELLDHTWYSSYGIGTIVKYNNGENDQLLFATGTRSNNWTKGNPCLSADILGDWREEVIWRKYNNTALRIYTTTDLTDTKIYTLMDDPQYRAAIGWQPNSYNQPPHPSFFIGTDMDSIPPAPILFEGQKVYSTGTWDAGTTSGWYDGGDLTTFSDGDKVLFDVSATTSEITLSGSLAPKEVRVISPDDFTFTGSGDITGSARLIKAGEGNLTIANTNTYTGLTRVWAGQLTVNGTLSNSEVLVKRFAILAGSGAMNNGVVVEPYAYLVPGAGESSAGKLSVANGLTLSANSVVKLDLSSDPDGDNTVNDLVAITGDLNIEGEITLGITKTEDELSAGTYTLMTFTGDFNGSIDDITIEGLSGTPKELQVSNGELQLVVLDVRDATTLLWTGAVDDNWDLYTTQNWSNSGTEDYFVGGDSVVFDSSASQTTVNMVAEYEVGGVLVNADVDYTMEGDGNIAGESGLTKRGTGTLTVETSNSYTGGTLIESGILSVSTISNGGYDSPVGASSTDAANLVINGGELQLTNTTSISSDRNITIGANDGIIDIVDGEGQLTLTGAFSGEGTLIKDGEGTLTTSTANTHAATIVNAGTLELSEDDANVSGLGSTVTLNGGTLAMNDNAYSYTNDCDWDIVVPEGKAATLKMDSRCEMTGTLTGSGTLTLYSPFVRSDLMGDWSGFTGIINVTSDSGGGDFRIYNRSGYENATVNINGTLYAYNQTGAATSFGALGGTSAATLGYGTWNVGYNNEDATYAGVIESSSIVNKYGTGIWTLSNANTYTGATTVNEGTLNVTNTSGSATGTGSVTVYGTLAGTGTISGNVSLESGSTIAPGNNGVGILTLNAGVSLVSDGTLEIELDRSAFSNDAIASSSSVTLAGTLQVEEVNGSAFENGDSFDVIDASSISGSFDAIIPAAPGTGLEWDLSKLKSDGIISVAIEGTTAIDNQAAAVEVSIYPNPAEDVVYVSLANVNEVKRVEVLNVGGSVMSVTEDVNSELVKLSMADLSSGIYFIKVCTKDSSGTFKVLKK